MKAKCVLCLMVLLLQLNVLMKPLPAPDKAADCYCLNCERGDKRLLECYICCDDKCLNTATDCHDYCDAKTKCKGGKPVEPEKGVR